MLRLCALMVANGCCLRSHHALHVLQCSAGVPGYSEVGLCMVLVADWG